MDEEQEVEAPEPTAFVVSVYLVDRAYGGPEEGGWWYDCGEPCKEPNLLVYLKVFKNHANARRYRNALQRTLDASFNVGLPSISSVLSQGRYEACIDYDQMPQAYPAFRPHYE